jgi:hypothetical protein
VTSSSRRGKAVLREFLAERVFDLRELDADRFRIWLNQHLAHWREDPAFLQRMRIRDLRRAHPELSGLEEKRREARIRYEGSSAYDGLEEARRALAGARKAIAGLTHALRTREEATERERLTSKLEQFRARAEALDRQVLDLTRCSAERKALDRAEEALRRARARVGFDREVALLESVQRKQGRSSGASGAAFETAAARVTGSELLPELGGGADRGTTILRGVKLGAARTELDQVVVRTHANHGEPVDVLAVIEAKRNPNDLPRGLARRIENLAWLAGHSGGYEAEAYRTELYPSGHFEGSATHVQERVRYTSTRESFRCFLPDLVGGDLPRALYLITRDRMLWGVGSAGLGRIAHRISSDVAGDLEDEAYLARLLVWCKEIADPVEAPDLIRRYAEDGETARRVVLIGE